MMLILLVLFLPLALTLVLTRYFIHGVSSKPPPGPSAWQLWKNLPSLAEKPHIALKNLAKIYGPLFSMRIGGQFVVIASSPETSREVLMNRNLAGRYLPSAHYHVPGILKASLVMARECDSTWKALRSLGQKFMFSSKAVDSNVLIRKNKVMEMVNYLRSKDGQVVNIEDVIVATFTNIVSNILVSKDLFGVDILVEENDRKVRAFIHKLTESASTLGWSDLFPVLQEIDFWSKKKGMEFHRNLIGVWGDIIKERRAEHEGLNPKHGDLLGFLFENAFSDNEIVIHLMELLIAGADSTTSTTVWLMAELLKNPEILKRVHNELSSLINQEDELDESRLSECCYFDACIRETLRLHIVGPLGLPHRAIETCKVKDFLIPKDSVVLVNLWAIQTDSENWEDPMSFRPERFLNSKIDFRGTHFEFVPFGAGQRMCPGSNVAIKSVQVMASSLLYYFDWTLPNGVPTTNIDTKDKFRTILKKEVPLCLVPKIRGK